MVSLIALGVWISLNPEQSAQLYLQKNGVKGAISQGIAVGIGLGFFNLLVIVKITPWLGYSNKFLRETPHAGFPLWIMFPFGILLVSFLVEILFRGWILGRFLKLFNATRGGKCCAVLLSALYFSFDPFMLIYFKGYHWLALTDGIVWGGLLLKTGNLFSSISAHTVEVWIVYLVLKVFYA
jgi:membrane protease YdiL (CAAX protease family)